MKTLILILSVTVLFSACTREAAFHSEYKALIRSAPSDAEKRQYQFEYRLLCYAERHELVSHFSTSDGIDQFEAWMLGKAYLEETVGVCSAIALPVRYGDEWVIATSVGRESKVGPMIHVNSTTGRLVCDGHPSIDAPLAFLTRYFAKFKNT